MLLIFVGLGAMLGRILAVDSVDKIALEDYRVKQACPPTWTQAAQSGIARAFRPRPWRKQLAQSRPAGSQQAELRRPFLSANDRSRWCTVRALVEAGHARRGALMPSTG